MGSRFWEIWAKLAWKAMDGEQRWKVVKAMEKLMLPSAGRKRRRKKAD